MLKYTAIILASAALTTLATIGAEPDQKTSTPPNDAQIAKIVLVANTVDVDHGKYVVKKTESADVKAFAQTMVRDHSAVNDKAIALAKKLGVTPEDSATSKGLHDNGKAELKKLKKLKGAAFDKAYVDNEVSYHVAVIDVLDKVLIPNTKNAELKALLKSSRPVFVAHLKHAKMLQKQLNK